MSQEGDLFGRYWVSGEDTREKKIESGYGVMDHAGRCAQNDGLPQEGIGGHGPGEYGGAIEDHLGPGFTDSCQCNIVGVNGESSRRNNQTAMQPADFMRRISAPIRPISSGSTVFRTTRDPKARTFRATMSADRSLMRPSKISLPVTITPTF